MFLIK